MKAIVLTALLGQAVQGHYIFSQLIVNGAAQGQDYTYIRKNTNTYMPSYTSEIVNSEELRCNKGATTASSQTLDVKAGDKIGFKLAYNEFIEHPGPAFIYMSKAPSGSVSSYDGSGDWFKAWESGLCGGTPGNDASWCTWQKPTIEFTIPAEIEDGEYLVRAEHIAIHEGHVGKAQFYMECAQLAISGGSGGSPSPTAKIPGIYSAEDPGIAFNKWNNPTSYEIPGPAVATFGGASGNVENSVSGSNTTTGNGQAAQGQEGIQSTPALPSNPWANWGANWGGKKRAERFEAVAARRRA